MSYDKSAIMRDAHRRYRACKSQKLNFTFAECLSTAWAAEKIRCTPEYQRDYVRDWHGPERKRTPVTRPATKAA